MGGGRERRVGPCLPSTLCTFLAAWLLCASVSSSVSNGSTSFAQLSHPSPGRVSTEPVVQSDLSSKFYP